MSSMADGYGLGMGTNSKENVGLCSLDLTFSPFFRPFKG